MTLLIAFCSIPSELISNMASNPVKVRDADTLMLRRDMRKWSKRRDSFSSCSNDSAIFCNNSSSTQTSSSAKRKRNSSGSSASSSLSSISDKDNKKASSDGMSNAMATVEEVKELEGRISRNDLGTATIELQHETVVGNGRTCSNPERPYKHHNLRSKIRKPACGCGCSTQSCTTRLVVRRIQEIGQKTVTKETVISRTKVQNFDDENNGMQEHHEVTFENSYSPSKLPVSCAEVEVYNDDDAEQKLDMVPYDKSRSDGNRKRRSEVEKLYDSLHEIKWAKNFSPDNILRQIHIRQAASTSLFGQSPVKQCPKRQKALQDVKINLEESRMSKESSRIFRSTRSATLGNQSRQLCNENTKSSNEVAKYKKRNSQRNDVLNSSVKEQNHRKETSSESNLIESSVECFELKENLGKLNNKKRIKVRNSSMACKSISNTTDSITNSSLINNFESTNSNTTLLPSYYNGLDMDNMELTSEYSLMPTFFDISQDHIRTIDACFREVGAEVVISTCYEPHLTAAVKESKFPDKVAISDDCPPVLVPCMSYQAVKDENTDSFNSCQFQIDCVPRPREDLLANGDVNFLGNVPQANVHDESGDSSDHKCVLDVVKPEDVPEMECEVTAAVEVNGISDSDDKSNLDVVKSDDVDCHVPETEFELTGEVEESVHCEISDSDIKETLEVPKPEEPDEEKETSDCAYLDVLKRISRDQCNNNSLIQKLYKKILNKYLTISRAKVEVTPCVVRKEDVLKKKYLNFDSSVKRNSLNFESSASDVGRPSTTDTELVITPYPQGYLCATPEKRTFNHSNCNSYSAEGVQGPSTSDTEHVATHHQHVYLCTTPEKKNFQSQ